MSKDQIIELAEKRGFRLWATLNGTQLQFLDEYGINLFVTIDNLNFELKYLIPNSAFRFILPECSPFDNDEHFKKMYKKFRREVIDCWGHLT